MRLNRGKLVIVFQDPESTYSRVSRIIKSNGVQFDVKITDDHVGPGGKHHE